jgi:RNA polymerase sigma-70 factor (ECF subfamily)
MHEMVPIDPLRQILDAAAEGDDVAMAELVRRTQSDVWRLCTALGSPGEEEDLVQETYLRAIRSAPNFRADAKVKTWLLSIARNVCADHVRHRQRQRRLVERIIPTVQERLEPSDLSTHALLADIAEERRDAFLLTQVVGISYEEAAAVLDCPVGTIRSRVARARADLLAAVRRSEAV